MEALKFKECTKLLGPVVEGTVVPNGTRVPGTPYQLDPVNGAFNIGAMIRWLDYNDCWLAAEWGHPSDNLGGILGAVLSVPIAAVAWSIVKAWNPPDEAAPAFAEPSLPEKAELQEAAAEKALKKARKRGRTTPSRP